MPDPCCVTCGGPPHVESDCPRPEHRRLIGAMWSFDGVVHAYTKNGWMPICASPKPPRCAGCDATLAEGEQTSYCSSQCSCLGAVWCVVCWNRHIDRTGRDEPEFMDEWRQAIKRNLGDTFYTLQAKRRESQVGSLNELTARVLDWVAKTPLRKTPKPAPAYQVTPMGAPTADSLVLGEPLDQLVDIAKRKLVERQKAAAAEPLWQLLDDIDTLSDIAKGDLTAFYTRAMQIAAKRCEFAKSPDGQTLVWSEPQ